MSMKKLYSTVLVCLLLCNSLAVFSSDSQVGMSSRFMKTVVATIGVMAACTTPYATFVEAGKPSPWQQRMAAAEENARRDYEEAIVSCWQNKSCKKAYSEDCLTCFSERRENAPYSAASENSDTFHSCVEKKGFTEKQFYLFNLIPIGPTIKYAPCDLEEVECLEKRNKALDFCGNELIDALGQKRLLDEWHTYTDSFPGSSKFCLTREKPPLNCLKKGVVPTGNKQVEKAVLQVKQDLISDYESCPKKDVCDRPSLEAIRNAHLDCAKQNSDQQLSSNLFTNDYVLQLMNSASTKECVAEMQKKEEEEKTQLREHECAQRAVNKFSDIIAKRRPVYGDDE